MYIQRLQPNVQLEACAMLDKGMLSFDANPAGNGSVQAAVGDAIEDGGKPSAAPIQGADCTDGW